ncbi:MAG: hypothetical protein ACE37D_01750 [Pseudomonadales bacterium]
MMISGYAESVTEDLVMASGGFGVLSKPINLKGVQTALNAVAEKLKS